MRIVMIGSGYVGLVSGVCFSGFGHDVVCVDKDPEKVASLTAGQVPFYEPGLTDMMQRNADSGRLRFSLDLGEAVKQADAVFIAVGTPSRRGDGHADLAYVYAAVEELAPHLQGYTVLVTKSTVPVGTNAEVQRRAKATNGQADFDVVSNPEFLREGSAIDDFMWPDRVVVGTQVRRARDVMHDVYRPLSLREAPVVYMDIESAELAKYAANAFLAVKITFINQIADLCEATGADVQSVARGMGLDKRIGSKFLHAGPGYGGSCFPKDTKALARTGQEHSAPQSIVEEVIAINEARKHRMVDRILELCDDSFNGKQITVFGVTFKPETDDMRDSPSLVIVPALIGAGASVRVVDPHGRAHGEEMLPGVEWVQDPYEAAKGSDAIVLLTEWNAFRALDLERLCNAMKTPRMADLRNVYKPADARAAGFTYFGIGRGA